MTKIEVFILDTCNGWDMEVVEVPDDLALSESHDAFLAWAYSDAGKAFRNTWHPDTVAVFVSSWNEFNIEEAP